MGLFSRKPNKIELENIKANIHKYSKEDLEGLLPIISIEIEKRNAINPNAIADKDIKDVKFPEKRDWTGTDISGVKLTEPDEIPMEQLETGVLGGTTIDIGEEAFDRTFGEPIKGIDLVDEDGNELPHERQK